jgi:hypothetical protein
MDNLEEKRVLVKAWRLRDYFGLESFGILV